MDRGTLARKYARIAGAFALAFSVSSAEGRISRRPASQFKGEASAGLDATYAHRLTPPQRPSSEKLFFWAEGKADFDSVYSTVISGQAWVEGVYADSVSYPKQMRAHDFYEARLQDTYLQMKTRAPGNGRWIFRLGLQQVVWGEAFGVIFADVVNPRDLREGLPLDVAKTRLATPMANAKYVAGSFSAQAVYIPIPHYNILPLPGSDFAPKVELPPGVTIEVEREKTGERPGELGARLSQTIGKADLSIFYLNHDDRNPYYDTALLISSSPKVTLIERHSRISTAGGALAADIGGFMLRSEGVAKVGRILPVWGPGGLVDAQKANEFSYAASLEFPTWRGMNFAAQYSESILSEPADYILAARVSRYATIRVQTPIRNESSFETILTYSPEDKGTRAQAELKLPTSSRTELRLGVESFMGPPESEFGRLRGASRVYMTFKLN